MKFIVIPPMCVPPPASILQLVYRTLPVTESLLSNEICGRVCYDATNVPEVIYEVILTASKLQNDMLRVYKF